MRTFRLRKSFKDKLETTGHVPIGIRGQAERLARTSQKAAEPRKAQDAWHRQ